MLKFGTLWSFALFVTRYCCLALAHIVNTIILAVLNSSVHMWFWLIVINAVCQWNELKAVQALQVASLSSSLLLFQPMQPPQPHPPASPLQRRRGSVVYEQGTFSKFYISFFHISYLTAYCKPHWEYDIGKEENMSRHEAGIFIL